MKEVLENALLGVQTDNYQLPLFTKDSKRVELLLNAATRCDASGAIVGVMGVGQDITRSQAVGGGADARRQRPDTAHRHGERAHLRHRLPNGLRERVEQQGRADHGLHRKDEVMGQNLVRSSSLQSTRTRCRRCLRTRLRARRRPTSSSRSSRRTAGASRCC